MCDVKDLKELLCCHQEEKTLQDQHSLSLSRLKGKGAVLAILGYLDRDKCRLNDVYTNALLKRNFQTRTGIASTLTLALSDSLTVK